jgi:alpha-1,6-mannosyltransferase
LSALGWSLLAFVVLGPVVWPWYETWGIVFLAVAAGTLARRVILILSAVGCFATVPSHLALTTPGAASLALGLALVSIALLVFVLLSKRGLSGSARSGFVTRRVP